jgi:23S rRNA pseudouridine955/2504/2580 synthase
MQSFVVDAGSDGKNLVRVILGQYPGLAATQVFQALRRKDIRINGRRQHSDGPVAAGDHIAVYLPDGLLTGGQAGSVPDAIGQPPYTIIYQDPLILIVNKKPGITVHQADGAKEQGPFLIDRVRADLQNANLELCHRLDRQTGGLILLAKKPAALQAVCDLMQSDLILKRYRCLVRGVPDQGVPVICSDGTAMLEITGWLEKDASRSDVYIHDLKEAGDLPITTRFRVLRIFSAAGPDEEAVSELEVELVTGRTHQIRAHLAHIGHPLLGDGKYGRNTYNRHFRSVAGSLRRQQLYSTQLLFLQQSKGPLAYLAGRTFAIEPEYDWVLPDQ